MGKALYRKYRSKSLDEIVGQPHITKTLSNALKAGKISHAYLFTGPRGVGKTSIARILAHAVNDLPYDEEATHIDIIEIDAASNRRIDEIRDLRDKVNITPTSGRYKVYIIDEVHMLTREAFNALLKTLEEPPEHVIFILATTEAHKLPATIISRTQRFTFKPIEAGEVVTHLRSIADKEKIDVSDDALQLIAEHGGGSFRDSISLLDQASSLGKKVAKSDVERLLGLAPKEAVSNLQEALASGAPQDVITALKGLREQGFAAASIAKQLSAVMREDILNGHSNLPADELTALLGTLLSVPSAHDPDSFLELTLITPVLERTVLTVPVPAANSITPKEEPAPVKPTVKKKAEPEIEEPKESIEAPKAKPEPQAAGSILESWPQVLVTLRKRHNTLYSVARMAEPDWTEERLLLKFAFPFHQKRLNDAKNQQMLHEVITEVTGQSVKLECIIDKQAKPPVSIEAAETPAAADVPLNTISNIFGSVEMLE